MSSRINIRVDEDLKKEVTELFDDLGMDVTTAITLFLKKSVEQHGIPFAIRKENPETLRAIYEAEAGITKEFNSVESLMKDLNDEN